MTLGAFLDSDIGAARAAKYDKRIAEKLLRRYDIPDEHRDLMLRDSEHRCGIKSLSLFTFHEFYPTFPICLRTTYFPYVSRDCTVADLFKRFDQTMLVLRYETVFEDITEEDAELPCGMVFDWPYLQGGGGMVLHNQPINVDVPGTRLFYVSKQGRQLVMETLDVVLDTIDANAPGGGGWLPEIRA
jgi:hypothetical protein